MISPQLAMTILGSDLAVPLVEETFRHLGEIVELRRALSARRVVVTGGAGSIGGALAVELISDPERSAPVVVIDTNERSVASLINWVNALGLRDNLITVVADVSDPVQMAEVFDEVRAEVVVHAAAVKHVGTCEANPRLAERVNVEATRILLAESQKRGVERFLLVSTDKATSRMNVLGQSKYRAELEVAAAAGRGLGAASVRLPNVWGSSGSVVELWRQSIALGLPVTLFGPETTRYYQSVYDTVRILLTLVTSPASAAGSTFVVADAVRIPLGEVLQRVTDAAGDAGELQHRIEAPRPGEIAHEQLTSAEESYSQTAWAGILELRHER
ncbi:SDR family NAD(P)-dependent oxidoreductase [Herbiconiux sp. A18JL235]|uniref:SDR family NAD(P)-dependent oxidoreductase n=1 Tax=Herbiconiux sp. A18JL235 TaxID=3152363 RepID=A0AB39BKA3_9MICO